MVTKFLLVIHSGTFFKNESLYISVFLREGSKRLIEGPREAVGLVFLSNLSNFNFFFPKSRRVKYTFQGIKCLVFYYMLYRNSINLGLSEVFPFSLFFSFFLFFCFKLIIFVMQTSLIKIFIQQVITRYFKKKQDFEFGYQNF